MLRKSLLILVIAAYPASMVLANEVFLFTVKDEFEDFMRSTGKVQKGLTEDFEPPPGNTGSNIVGPVLAILVDPLTGNIPNVDAVGLGFPTGLVNKNLTIQSNLLGPNAPQPSPGTGLVGMGPGFLNPDQPVPNSVVVGPNALDDSLDLIFSRDENHTGIGFDVIDPVGMNVVHITIFDKNEDIIEKVDWPGSDEKVFFGVWSKDTIGRINIAGITLEGLGGGELVDNIQMWVPEPATLSLLVFGGLALLKGRRA